MKYAHYITAFFCFALVSCETVIDIELPEEPSKLVLNCYFTPDSVWVADLSASKPILSSDELPQIDGADIFVSNEDGEIFNMEPLPGQPGLYSFNQETLPNQAYTINVSAQGFANIVASSKVPEATMITSVDTGSVTFTRGFGEQEVSVTIQDPPGVRNYYELQLFLQADNGAGGLTSFGLPFSFANEDIFSFEDGQGLIDDTRFDGREFRIDVLINPLGFETQVLDSIATELFLTAELRTVSEDYFLYESTLSRYQFSSNDPFSQPAQVYNNVTGGFGIFAGFNSSSMSLPLN